MNRLLVVILAVATSALIFAAASAEENNSTKPPVRPKTIFAHYMGCCPLATGPQAYIKGEEAKTLRHGSSDKAAQHGGHVRNWDLVPYGMKLTAEESADLEIRRAMRIGIDGFAIDAWAGNQDARRSLDALLKVAAEKNYPFEVTICIDPMCGGDIVASVKELLEKHGKNPKLARRDGKPLIFGYQSWIPSLKYLQKVKPGLSGEETSRLRSSPEGWEIMGQAFKDAEKQIGQPIYWHYCMNSFFHGIDKKLVPPDGNLRAASALAKHVQAVGSFAWLGKDQAAIGNAIIAAGAEWSHPVGFYQKENIPYEVYAGKGLDWMCGGWEGKRQSGTTLMQFTTWNDYGENSNIAPAYNTRYTLYDLTGYFIQWWKTGKEPAADHDRVYLISRKYPPKVKVSPFQQGPYVEGAIEVATILTAPAKVRLPGRDAEYDAPAGFFRKQFPVTPGLVAAELVRDGKTVLKIESPEPVTDRPFREDNSMVCWSSEEERLWKADFGDKPMFIWSEYGDIDQDGLPNWFEMYWFGKWGDMSTAGCADPKALGAGGKTLLQHYLDQTDPAEAQPRPVPTTDDKNKEKGKQKNQ
jgi:hypothetical protein